jgi:hypothetical protein
LFQPLENECWQHVTMNQRALCTAQFADTFHRF